VAYYVRQRENEEPLRRLNEAQPKGRTKTRKSFWSRCEFIRAAIGAPRR
jgi:hypothetical protein